MSEVIDFRVRLPLELRPSEELPDDYLAQYDRVLDLSANRHRSLADLMADMDASGTGHAVVHAEYEYGEVADALNEAVAKVVTEHPDRFSGYGTISMNPVKIPRALAQVQRVADLGLAGLSLQPSFFGIPIDDRVLYPVYAKAGELGLQVALHTGINYTVTFPIRNDQPIQVDQVACDFPDLVLVACHAGWPWVPEMVAVLRKHPNVYAEFGGRQAGSPGWLRSNTAARMRISEPKVMSAYRTVYILNELPMPTRNRTAARKIVIRM